MELDRCPELAEPVLVAAFEGWNDAGDAATGAVEHLELAWDAQQIGVDRLRRLLRLPGQPADRVARRRRDAAG